MVMEITEHVVGDVTVLALKGRFVLEEGENPFRECIEALVRQGRIKIVLDMREVTYLDSAGLGVLVGKYVSVHRRGGNIKLLLVTPRSEHILEVTKLTRVFEMFESEEAAVHSFDVVPARPIR